jgi:hypothetical protein
MIQDIFIGGDFMLKRVLRCSSLIALCGFGVLSAASVFNYATAVNIFFAPTAPSNPPGFSAAAVGIGSGNTLTFTSISGVLQNATGGVSIPIGDITFTAGDSTPITFGINFNWHITLADGGSKTGFFNLTGLISGNAVGTPTSISSGLSNLALTKSSLTLDTKTYFLSLGSMSGPNGTGTNVTNGHIFVNVSDTSSAPEPSTVILIAAGSGLLCLLRGRGRRSA